MGPSKVEQDLEGIALDVVGASPTASYDSPEGTTDPADRLVQLEQPGPPILPDRKAGHGPRKVHLSMPLPEGSPVDSLIVVGHVLHEGPVVHSLGPFAC